MTNISASEVADLYQYGEYDEDNDKKWVDECICWEYDWEMMEEENRHCEDKLYIPNLRRDLGKICNCPYHADIRDNGKYKTPHLRYTYMNKNSINILYVF